MGLTNRERQVLRLVVEGCGNQQIAERLTISKRTVETHVSTLLRKYGVDDRRTLTAALGPATFRASLSHELRASDGSVETQSRVAHLVGRHLAVHRSYYQEFDHEADVTIIHRDYADGVKPIAGAYTLSHYVGEPVAQAMRTGEPLVVSDSSALVPKIATAWHSLSIRAAMMAPNLRDGACVAGLAVTSTSPREWTMDDVTLLVETAERTWDRVERIRLEAELGEVGRSFRALADAVPCLVWQTDAGGAVVFGSRALLDFTGLTPETVRTVDWRKIARPTPGAPDPAEHLRDDTWQGRLELRRHDGTWQQFDAGVSPRRDDVGAQVGHLWVVHRS
ncbi:LuxR C-terminal-related transcriptional regulator [Nocardioides panacisoli]|uniref:LuxR C-terminal-related transcriptional regulator n=1 Tax=Nocardioides panacisoli TaxID=627624 RepID=UPI001C63123C|nr:LuxR C-terminal-related transcriptional regulator [Nocardioides panacisoli]QYJ03330.1 LuxR C-terminal-related transcriptional regulator [Nocardioides panacisoli]